ncbi:regulation of nuclear pre-mRNA domain-containing protein 1A [Dorcoceras hygrometricum]|uniref:Regulation of nuclear pre-mRNA domain-containing protein 1A n=1 Tax=Dorcoceras hygrometricum TaxID=472368 RepID=A0A2Z7CLA6_9LAMI|nr:regulation of nuclear pre-mRNA domain-containing protein 1A [Dorcoceras hygrometricum]
MCAHNVAHHARHHRALAARWTAPGRALAARMRRVGRPVITHWLHEVLADDGWWMCHCWALFRVRPRPMRDAWPLDVRLFARLPRNVLPAAVAVRPPSGDDLWQIVAMAEFYF